MSTAHEATLRESSPAFPESCTGCVPRRRQHNGIYGLGDTKRAGGLTCSAPAGMLPFPVYPTSCSVTFFCGLLLPGPWRLLVAVPGSPHTQAAYTARTHNTVKLLQARNMAACCINYENSDNRHGYAATYLRKFYLKGRHIIQVCFTFVLVQWALPCPCPCQCQEYSVINSNLPPARITNAISPQ